MPIFQYKCQDCQSVFEYFEKPSLLEHLACLYCGSEGVSRVLDTYFYPNKTFCPHDKDLDADALKVSLSGIMSNTNQKCGGCGTDGAPGKCNSGGAGCGGNCSCGKGGCGRK